MLQDLAVNTPVSEMQILTVVSKGIASKGKFVILIYIYDSQHPGFVFTPMNAEHGYTRESLPFDDESLPGNFYVWAATKKAAFLHGRFVWANWDVNELIAMKPKIEADKGFLKVGLLLQFSDDPFDLR
jgi:hypothetical protein